MFSLGPLLNGRPFSLPIRGLCSPKPLLNLCTASRHAVHINFSVGAIEQHQFVRAGHQQSVAFRDNRDTMHSFIWRTGPGLQYPIARRIDYCEGVLTFYRLIQMFKFRIEGQIFHAAAVHFDGGYYFFVCRINYPHFARRVIAFINQASLRIKRNQIRVRRNGNFSLFSNLEESTMTMRVSVISAHIGDAIETRYQTCRFAAACGRQSIPQPTAC